MLKALTATTMNWGDTFTCPVPDEGRLRQLASFAADGFGDVAAIFPELAGVTVEGRAEGGAVALVVRAGGHVLGTAYAALTGDAEAAAWGLAEGNYLRDSDKFSVEMDAKACPEKPANLPWVAAIVWPILLRQESDAAYGNFWNVVAAATYGAAALLADQTLSS